MNLAEFEIAVEKAENLEVGIDTDQYGEPLYPNVAQAAAQRLRNLSAEIRRCCWNFTCLDAARRLADQADESASKIEAAEGILAGREPRFPASYQSCSGYIRAIN